MHLCLTTYLTKKTNMRIDVHLAILKVLSYFHFFRYPLREDEIKYYLPNCCTYNELTAALEDLLQAGVIFSIDNFYSLSDDHKLVAYRLSGNKHGAIQLKKAYRVAKFLGRFPFVDSVYISGSLSKDFSLPDGDLDYFIITAPGRLWIARFLMHLFKKFTFLVGKQHSFCMNYYLGAEKLELDVQNYYTAIELVTLKPAYSVSGSYNLYNSNKEWVDKLLPNNSWEEYQTPVLSKKGTATALLEKVINMSGGDSLNRLTYKFTRWKWRKKWARKGYDVEQCLKCMAIDINSPLNYPKNLMEVILDGHNEIYSKAERTAKEKLTVVPSTARQNSFR